MLLNEVLVYETECRCGTEPKCKITMEMCARGDDKTRVKVSEPDGHMGQGILLTKVQLAEMKLFLIKRIAEL